MNRFKVFLGGFVLVCGLLVLGPAAETLFVALDSGVWSSLNGLAVSPQAVEAALPFFAESAARNAGLGETETALVRQYLESRTDEFIAAENEFFEAASVYVRGRSESAADAAAPLRSFLSDIETSLSAPGLPSAIVPEEWTSGLTRLETEVLPEARAGYKTALAASIAAFSVAVILSLLGLIIVFRSGGRFGSRLRALGTPLLIYGIPMGLVWGAAWLFASQGFFGAVWTNIGRSALAGMETAGSELSALLDTAIFPFLSGLIAQAFGMLFMPITWIALVVLGLGITLKLVTPPKTTYED